MAGCKQCSHAFREHDDYRCRHAACGCRITQRKIMAMPIPAVSSARSDEPMYCPGIIITKEYPNISGDNLFRLVVRSVKELPYFKIWKIDANSKTIDLTTYSTNLSWGSGRREQVDVTVLEPSASNAWPVLELRITPSLSGTTYLEDVMASGSINEKKGRYIADMIHDQLGKNLNQG
jgi:hypothetical protein